MKRRIVALLLAAVWAPAQEKATRPEWPVFRGDPSRSGQAHLSMEAAPYRHFWTFDLGSHTWKYCQGASVWSSNAVGAILDGRMRIFVGSYDHNIYCIDPETGKELWRFTTGCLVKASPAFAWVNGEPMLFVASSDRCFYGLNARTGKKLWNYETYSWTYTVGESVAGSPLVVDLDGKSVLYATMWNGDRSPLRTTQNGDLYAIEAATGQVIWRERITSGHLSTPTFFRVGKSKDSPGKPMLYFGSEDGNLYACDARTGKVVWRVVTEHRIDAAPLVANISGSPVVIVGNAWGMVRAMHAESGVDLWYYKAGHEILSTPVLFKAGDMLLLAIGSSDRCVHAIEAKAGDEVWKFQTDKYVVSSPAVADINGRPAVFINSLDNRLYVLDGETGCKLMDFASGDMLWPYETRGASLWSSPSLIQRDNGKALLLYPAHDGKLYAFTEGGMDEPPVDGAQDAKLTGWSPESGRRHVDRVPVSPFARTVPPVIGLVLLLLGAVIVFLPRRQAPTA
jgi:outer membrane protein assembly factor BamB